MAARLSIIIGLALAVSTWLAPNIVAAAGKSDHTKVLRWRRGSTSAEGRATEARTTNGPLR